MALPSNVSTGTVTGQFVIAVADGADTDYAPDTYPVQGTVTFTPSVPYLPNPGGGVTILVDAITGILDESGFVCTPDPDNPRLAGRRGVQLIATDDPDLSVMDWTWQVTYKFEPRNKAPLPAIPPHSILVPSDGTVDLTSVVKVPSSAGVGIEQVTTVAAAALQSKQAAAASATASAQSATASAGSATTANQRAQAASTSATQAATAAGTAANDAAAIAAETVLASNIDAADLARLALVGAADRGQSVGNSNIAYQDAPGFAEEWAALTAWSNTGVQVSGGLLYAVAGAGSHGAKKSLPSLSGSARIIGSVKVVAAGAGTGLTLVGVDTTTNETTYGGTSLIAIGVNELGVPVRFNGGTSTALNDGTALPAGTYHVSVSITAAEVSLTLYSTDSSTFYLYGQARSVFGTPTHVQVWNSDARALGGNAVGPVGVRTGAQYVTVNPRGTVETVNRWARYAVPPRHTMFATIVTPAGYDSRKPCPVVIYAHGSGDADTDVTVMKRPAAIGPVAAALVNAGFIVASSTFGGTSNWGNAESVDTMAELYRHLRDSYNIGPIVLMGHSMGGLVTLNTLGRRQIPNIVGYVGVEPVVSLATEFGMAFTSAIRSAYGIAADNSDYAAKTAGYDPALMPGSAFRGLPMWLTASMSDTVVPQVYNTDALRTKVAPYSKDVTFYQATGPHVDPSHFQTADIVAFCSRVTKG